MTYDFNGNVNTLFERLEKFFTSKTVVGEKIQIGDVTIIPLISYSFGLGAGGGADPNEGAAEGGGGGIGAKATPTAILVIKGDDVQMMQIGAQGGFEKLVDMVPGIVSKVMKEDETKEEDDGEEE